MYFSVHLVSVYEASRVPEVSPFISFLTQGIQILKPRLMSGVVTILWCYGASALPSSVTRARQRMNQALITAYIYRNLVSPLIVLAQLATGPGDQKSHTSSNLVFKYFPAHHRTEA